ncbi:MAG TPA: multiheme c-type cytochrome, partial [Terriglobales bacterium]|nr:multiheme c-type cytochrome [Terriglobales bacterium]
MFSGVVRRMAVLNISFTRKLLFRLMLVLLVSAAYLYPFPQANLLYPAGVAIHVLAGILATALLGLLLWPLVREGNIIWKAGWLLLAAGAALGVLLVFKGTPHSEYRWLYVHLVMSMSGIACLLAEFLGRRGWLSSNAAVRLLVCLALLGGLGWAARYQRESRWLTRTLIKNQTLPPASMDGEGDGPSGPFFPSSAQVYGGQKIPSKFFMESESCKRCHEDIYKQWNSSAHHFSSFNNQWYRKSIEYMQDVVGTRPSKWCGGCHDPAVLYAGKMDT